MICSCNKTNSGLPMKANRLSKLSLAIGLSVATTSALASPQAFMSARSFAMGGTGVAVAHPSAAPSANPAMMAAEQHDWADDFGLMLPSVNARAADEEEVIDQVDDIQDLIDGFEDFKSSNPTEAQANARELIDRLEAFDRDTMRANVGLGLGFAIPTNSISVGFFTAGNLTATVRGEFDERDRVILEGIAALDPSAVDSVNLEDNLQSRGRILASAVVEAGISFAKTFELNNTNALQLGVSP
ncbi:MAG TPA: conjugal transfer protein TraF, partial [Marinobacter hydrocarbonoclasticus]|nr:conjugal transfer protein TraF [Marinobacter nauticus]